MKRLTGARASIGVAAAMSVAALAPAAASTSVLALVSLPAPPDPAVVATLRSLGLDVNPLRHVPAAVVRGTPAELDRAAALPTVLGVEPDRPLELYLDDTVALVRAPEVYAAGYTGAGVGVAVLDSGVDATHQDLPLGTKVVQNVKLLGAGDEHTPLDGVAVGVPVEDLPNTDTTSGHGTHVAGIVAGSGAASGGRLHGVAPGATLVGVGSGEAPSMVTASLGMDWIIEHKDEYGIRVVNNSWGDGSIPYDPGSVLNRATRAVHDAGIVVVQAAGNDGTAGAGTISRYCIPDWVVCVGASTKRGALASLSSRGDPARPEWWPDLIAPGEYVTSTRSLLAPGATVNFSPFDLTDPAAPEVLSPDLWTTYEVKSGTSMAAPHVAGVVALLLEANPRLSPDAVREVLRSTAAPVAACQGYACGAGLVDAAAAVDRVEGVRNVKRFVKDGWEYWGAEVVHEWAGTVGDAGRTFAVEAGAASLDVTIRWTDVLADLDLVLTGPTSTSTAMASITQLPTAGDRGETLSVRDPVAGTWRARATTMVPSLTAPSYRGVASVVYPL